jgi:hypothetical protein
MGTSTCARASLRPPVSTLAWLGLAWLGEPSHSSYPSAYEDGTENVPKRRHIKSRSRGTSQKKAYTIQNTAKVWNQEISFDLHDPLYIKGQLPTLRTLNLGEISSFNFATHFHRDLQSYQLIRTIWYTFMDYKIFCDPEYVRRCCVIWSILISCCHVGLCFPSYILLRVSQQNPAGISLRPHPYYVPCPLNSIWLITILCTEDYKL